jgi:adenylate cyclase
MLATGNIQLPKNSSMNWFRRAIGKLSFIALYRLRWIAIISFSWTAIELLLYYRIFYSEIRYDHPYYENVFSAYMLRAVILLCMNAVMAYMILVELRVRFRDISLLAGWTLKTFLLLLVAALTVSSIFIAHFIVIREQSFSFALNELTYYFFHTGFFVDSMFSWFFIIPVTQIVIEVDQKYSPGVFWEILTGKYVN